MWKMWVCQEISDREKHYCWNLHLPPVVSSPLKKHISTIFKIRKELEKYYPHTLITEWTRCSVSIPCSTVVSVSPGTLFCQYPHVHCCVSIPCSIVLSVSPGPLFCQYPLVHCSVSIPCSIVLSVSPSTLFGQYPLVHLCSPDPHWLRAACLTGRNRHMTRWAAVQQQN